ncbi:hypothetical protein ABID22_003811 [Pontibacter aydingkolensis]
MLLAAALVYFDRRLIAQFKKKNVKEAGVYKPAFFC